jgi:Mg/Co/Ni transporter MgtE
MAINYLSRYFVEQHPRESARILEKYSIDLLMKYLEELPDNDVANLVRYLSPDHAVSCLVALPVGRSAKILEHIGVDGAGRLLSRMKLNVQNTILSSMPSAVSRRLKLVLRYPIGTIGHYMSPDIYIANVDMLIGEIVVSAKSAGSELLDDIFIVDEQQVLVGVVAVKNLVFADADDEVKQIMNIPGTVLNVRTNLEYIKNHPRWRFKETLPVVDQKNVFVGVLRRSTLREVLSGQQAQERNDSGIMETVVDVADLFWEVCFSFIYPQSDTNKKADIHDRSKS